AMALMTGYQHELQRKLTSGGGAVLAIPVGEGRDLEPAEVVGKLRGVPGVAATHPVVFGQGALSTAADPQGFEVTVRGVEPGTGPLSARQEQIESGEDGLPGAVLGEELARILSAKEGDVLRLLAVGFEDGRPRFRYQALRCTGTFSSGLSDFDRGWLLIRRELAADLFGSGGGGTMYEIAPVELAEASQVAQEVDEALGPGFLVSNWLELNSALFSALRLQKLFLFLVLGLIVFVSTFNVASTLVVAVRERMREIGVLGALGMSRESLWRAFLLYGGLLGLMGTALGVGVGCTAAWVMDRFELIRFDAEVAAIYFINAVRFEVRALDVAVIVAFALAVNLLACWLPAWRAVRIDPSAALRYE
ncbi:MAG: ABC transporter permease, partial [Acidobacteria bacterium]|nr:ABC transporter permease [Acidobacteriota bacterium]